MLIPQIVIRRYTDAKKPFLSVVTRHHLRGNDRVRMLDINLVSIKQFGDPDCEHVILVDDAARGIEFANGMFAAQKQHLSGEWIWILDDDEAAVAPGLVGALKAVVEEHKPDVVMVKHDRSFHVPNLIMPTKAVWGTDPLTPIEGRQQSGCFIVRRAVFNRHVKAFAGSWGGDFRFLSAMAKREPAYEIAWLDLVASKVLRVSGGA